MLGSFNSPELDTAYRCEHVSAGVSHRDEDRYSSTLGLVVSTYLTVSMLGSFNSPELDTAYRCEHVSARVSHRDEDRYSSTLGLVVSTY